MHVLACRRAWPSLTWGVGCGRGDRPAQVSMMDIDVWEKIYGVLSDAHAVRSGGTARGGSGRAHDAIGDIHLLLFGDFKQLPPATGKAPFIVMPLVHTFQFRVLRQNRCPSHVFVFVSLPYPLSDRSKTACGPRRGAAPGNRELSRSLN